MKSTRILLVLLILATACEERERLDPNRLFVSISIAVTDKNGNDLLNPATPGSLDKKAIRVLFKSDDFAGDLDGRFTVMQETSLPNSRYYCYVFPESEREHYCNLPYSKETRATRFIYLKWNETETDTLEVQLLRIKKSMRNEKVWLNGTLVSEATNSDPFTRRVEIIK